MLFYSIIILIATAIVVGVNSIFLSSLGATFTYVLVYTLAFVASAFLVDLVIGALVFFMPSKWFNPFSTTFKVHNYERKLYLKLGVRKWKDLIPIGKGPIGVGFAKDKISDPKNNDYLMFFLQDSCRAEIMHLLSSLLGFTLLIVSPRNIMLSVALPVIIVNSILQTMPVMVQRYNRPKIIALYNRNLRKLESKNKEEKKDD